MKKLNLPVVAALLFVAMVVSGCPDPRVAHVFHQASGNISSVALKTGIVTDDAGGLSTGPVTNRAVIRAGKAFVVNSGNFPGATGACIQVIDMRAMSIEKTIPLPDGENPWDIAFVSGTKAYVTAWIGDHVLVVDPVNGTVTKAIDLPEKSGPEGIVVRGRFAYTANSGYDASTWGYLPGSVSVIDTATDTVVDKIATTQINPQDIAVDSSGRLHVVCTGDYFSQFGVVDVIDPETRTVIDSVAVGGSPGNITTADKYALMGAGGPDSCDILVVNTDTSEVVHGGGDPWTLAEVTGWCTVGKIARAWGKSGIKAYVPAGAWGAEALLFELEIGAGNPTLARTFDLAPSANLPAAVGTTY